MIKSAIMNNVIDHIKARFQSISLKKEGLGLFLLSLGCLLFSIIQRFYSFSWMPVRQWVSSVCGKHKWKTSQF